MSFLVGLNQFALSIGAPVNAFAIAPADKITISPPKLKRNWDVKPGFGVQGAFCVYTGQGLATFDVTFEFWNEAKEALWNQFASVFFAAPVGTRPSVLGAWNPVLVTPPYAIQNVVVTDLEGWSLVTPGHWQTKVSFLEYRAPVQFTPKKAEPVVPAVVKAPPARPQTEQDKRIAEAIQAHKDYPSKGSRK